MCSLHPLHCGSSIHVTIMPTLKWLITKVDLSQMVLNQNRILQKYAKVPVFIACNPEQGGNGVCPDGTFVSSQVKIGATGKTEYAQAMGRVSGAQIKATGCNMAFAPVVDITYNWECEEVLSRAYGNDPKLVADMGKAYMDGLHETEGVFCCDHP